MAYNAGEYTGAKGLSEVKSIQRESYRVKNDGAGTDFVHTDAVYNTLLNACAAAEARLSVSLSNYQQHPDVQANLQQLQYDLASWNLTLTTMMNINKSMSDALSSIASNLR